MECDPKLLLMIWMKIDRDSDTPIYRQMYEQLVNRILSGKLKGGDRLPSTRQFAQDIGVSRNTVTEVYDQLMAEGFIEARAGSGTYVTCGIQIESDLYPGHPIPAPHEVQVTENKDRIRFLSGVPDAQSFPRNRWFRCLRRELFYGDVSPTDYGDVRGWLPLRMELSRYLANAKNIRCSPDQIFMVTGTSQALLLLATYFRQKLPAVYLEDPVIDYVPEIFRQHSYRLFSVPVDRQGMQVNQLKTSEVSGLVFVTPSHQFPTGSVLPISRRIELIKLARLHKHLIIEDDYDNEFRFGGPPIQSLHMLDPDRVIHLGTFSKTLGAGLRIGYMVIPSTLCADVYSFKQSMHMSTTVLDQAILGRFLAKGYFERHVARMKKRYRTKMSCLTRALKHRFGDRVEVLGNTAGMHLMVRFRDVVFDAGLKHAIETAHLDIEYLDDYSLSSTKPTESIILGYGNLSETQIEEGILRLSRVI